MTNYRYMLKNMTINLKYLWDVIDFHGRHFPWLLLEAR